jgi:UDP-N-acetylmuramoyl-L-alanyl-D-glutamate--2,6-diaminopimelate ligase
MASVFEAAGIRAGLMGTVAYRIAGRAMTATHTTPEAPRVQRLMRQMVDERCGACVMEVSSHALSLRRVDGVRFGAAIFTNLTRDHLDFHHSMEEYFAAKRRLFEMLPPEGIGIVNLDDPRGQALTEVVPRAVTYGIARSADVSRSRAFSSRSGRLADRLRCARGSSASRTSTTFSRRSLRVRRSTFRCRPSSVACRRSRGCPAASSWPPDPTTT